MRKLWFFVAACGLLLAAFASLLLHFHQVPLGNLPPDPGVLEERIVTSRAGAPIAQALQPGAGKPLSPEELRAFGVEAMRGMPSRGDLQRLRVREDFLATAPLLDTAAKVQRLLAATQASPGTEPEALLVLQDCATNDTYLSFVRALCFSGFRSLSRKVKRAVRAGLVPGSIRELADQLEQ